MSNSGAPCEPNKSMFAQTCSLLRNYVKEKGPLHGDHFTLSQGAIPADQKLYLTRYESPIELFHQQADGASSRKEASQMTIFYGGQVVVLNVPGSKAEEIMHLASKASSSVPAAVTAAVPHPDTTARPSTQLTVMDLQIKRKISLSLFLEKRKNRINARGPYKIKDEESSKSADDKPCPFTKQFSNMKHQLFKI